MDEHANPHEGACLVERALARVLSEMRQFAEEADPDDACEMWSRELLDRRPLVFVAALLPGQSAAWVVEPGSDDVLRSAAYHEPELSEYAAVKIVGRNASLDAIETHVNWLIRDLCDMPLTGRAQRGASH